MLCLILGNIIVKNELRIT